MKVDLDALRLSIRAKKAKKKPTAFELVAKRLKEQHGIELTNLRRTYAGNCMKASGALVWRGDVKQEGHWEIGSSWPASYLLKVAKWDIQGNGIGESEIVPVS